MLRAMHAARSKAAGGVKVPMHLLESISQSILSKEVPTNFLRHFCHLHLRAWKMPQKTQNITRVSTRGPIEVQGMRKMHTHTVFESKATSTVALLMEGQLTCLGISRGERWWCHGVGVLLHDARFARCRCVAFAHISATRAEGTTFVNQVWRAAQNRVREGQSIHFDVARGLTFLGKVVGTELLGGSPM